MSYCAPPMPFPSSGRATPAMSWDGASVASPASMHTLVDCRRRSPGGLTNCGLAEIRPVPVTLPLTSVELPQTFVYDTSNADEEVPRRIPVELFVTIELSTRRMRPADPLEPVKYTPVPLPYTVLLCSSVSATVELECSTRRP